ncbi:unnamed protein product [Chrysodeixis includens]|uniref:Uncharacterized protein n=1 Tax=Chrysodeixis includens TaxID=689277 RepID=A0A9N8PZA6_CHRIL|nr:unnamed protein product [Chrysodeixis includens]
MVRGRRGRRARERGEHCACAVRGDPGGFTRRARATEPLRPAGSTEYCVDVQDMRTNDRSIRLKSIQDGGYFNSRKIIARGPIYVTVLKSAERGKERKAVDHYNSKQSSQRHTSLGREDIDPKLLQLSIESVRTSFPVLRASIFATNKVSIKDLGLAGDLDRRAKSGESGLQCSKTSGDKGRCRAKLNDDKSGDRARLDRSGEIGQAAPRSVDEVRDRGGVALRQCEDVIFVARICTDNVYRIT